MFAQLFTKNTKDLKNTHTHTQKLTMHPSQRNRAVKLHCFKDLLNINIIKDFISDHYELPYYLFEC